MTADSTVSPKEALFLLERVLLILIDLSIFGSALTFIPIHSWILEVNANLARYYLGAHLLGLPLLILLRRRRSAADWMVRVLVLILLIAQYGVRIAPFYLPLPQALQTNDLQPSPNPRLRLLYANVCAPCGAARELPALLAQYRPNLLALLEVDRPFSQELGLAQDYPHFVEEVQPGCFGIGLYSQFPFERPGLESLGEQSPPVVYRTIALTSTVSVELLLLHAVPPLGRQAYHLNRLLVRRATTLLKHSRENALLVGDLNATPFSRFYSMPLRYARLHNAMHGMGLLSTWDAGSRLRHLTLDHVFYRGALRVVSFKRLPSIGSDHFPLLVEFEVLG